MTDAIRQNPHILLVDDEESTLDSFEMTLAMAGFESVQRCSDSRLVMDMLHETQADVILLDLVMPHVSGENLLEAIREEYPDVEVVVITGIDTVESAVTCMRLGAYDYLVKPVEENRLEATVTRAVETQLLRRENTSLKKSLLSSELDQPEAFAHIITRDARMLHLFRYVEAIGTSNHPVVVTGESGVGKELLARSLHQVSRPKGPFVAVNVAGLDDTVFSDTLFGHCKGAFTGAQSARSGLVDKAAGGTLFLDEIGDLSPMSQVKLLRLIQEREYLPLGSDTARPADTRVLAATHCDLEAALATGRFRKDLYYRLIAHRVHIPPLRERKGDLPSLLDHFLVLAAEELGRDVPSCPPGLPGLLEAYHFPGNVRELEALTMDALSQTKGPVLSMRPFRDRLGDHLPESLPGDFVPGCSVPGELAFPDRLPTLSECSDLLVREAMRRSGDKQTVACKLLGITQPALSKRLKRMRLDDQV